MKCQLQYGAKYDEEFPPIMIYSLPTPFYTDRPINHELMKKTIAEGLLKLQSTGVSFIAMPCNSAHIYFDDLKESVGIPLLNIVEETLKMLPEAVKKITLFSTSTTFNSSIYQKGIENRGYEFVFENEWQGRLNRLIQGIKMDKENKQNVAIWNELIDEAMQKSVDSVIVACTDLNAVMYKSCSQINIIDSAKCLAKAVVGRYSGS